MTARSCSSKTAIAPDNTLRTPSSFWHVLISTRAELGDEALDKAVLYASTFHLEPDGCHNAARSLQDITRAEFNVADTGSTFYNALAGHGPHAHRVTLTFVHNSGQYAR